ncbi:hypothetical protein [Halosimplex sp. TS25]|uniref:DUF7344 domain-containing protein n=1 Tax=Halosimplex rarum TaxID=3396619 RepID=UPI0039E992CD
MTDTTTDRSTEFTSSANLSDADRYLLFSSERRRLVLDVLSTESGVVALDELAEEVAAQESDLDAADEQAMERLKTTLHHNHLPKLADADALDYDPTSHRIEP